MAEQKVQTENVQKKLNPVMLMQIAFAVVNLGVVGGGAYLVYVSTLGWHPPVLTEASLRNPASAAVHSQSDAEEPATTESQLGGELTPFLQRLDKFTVNLDGEPKRTIRLEVNLEMLNEESYEEVMDVARMPKIRDRIVAVLNEKSFSELESVQGKLFLKDRITAEVNTTLDKGVVKDVYFSEFVVQ